MRQQVQEMLYIEKGGDAQLTDELEAYNPLIPQGSELSRHGDVRDRRPGAPRRDPGRLGGIENHAFVEVAGLRVRGEPDPTRENTSPEGKASSVQFFKFRFAPGEVSRFKTPGTGIVIGFDHPNYAHMAVVPEPMRQALASDFD